MVKFMIKGQKDSVTPKQGFILKYKGTCDIKKLYKSSKDWFAKNNYKFSEKEFKEKWGPTGTEFKIHLEGERYVDEYLSFNIKIVFFIIDAKKINEKYKANVHVTADAHLLLDRKNKWQGNSIKSFLFFIYNNFIIKNKIENVYEDKLYAELMELINNIKQHIKLY